MAGKCELILARLPIVMASVPGIANAYRNRKEFPDTAYPLGVVWDGDEVADENDPDDREPGAPRIIHMTPESWFMLSGFPEDVGTTLNGFRDEYLALLMADDVLAGLVADGTGIDYKGCARTLARGRAVEASIIVSVTFTYYQTF